MRQKVEGRMARDAESLLFPVKIREWDLCLAVVPTLVGVVTALPPGCAG